MSPKRQRLLVREECQGEPWGGLCPNCIDRSHTDVPRLYCERFQRWCAGATSQDPGAIVDCMSLSDEIRAAIRPSGP